jgi:hypothetical protein
LVAIGLLVLVGVLPTDAYRDLTPIPIHGLDTAIGLVSAGLLVGLLLMSLGSIWGLLRREPWGWTLSIVTAGFVLTLSLATWMAGEPNYLSMLINSITVLFLNQRDLRAIFGVGASG